MRVLISGGGTGGHIFPAISIANALQRACPKCEILFVGANGRMEMQRIPDAGYKIVGLDVSGIERKKIWKNFKIIFDFIKSTLKARKIVKNFNPDVAVGVGGYVSAAAMWAAAKEGVPVVLQEQNSFAGMTNKFLSKKATKICVAYPKMEKFFDLSKIVITGNPIRQTIVSEDINRKEAYDFFHLNPNKKTLLVIGGSLGARTINQSILDMAFTLQNEDFQVIWQTGKIYFENIKQRFMASGATVLEGSAIKSDNFFISDFILKMDYAYKIADLVISRAGASSISELSLLGKPAILVPSPNVSENHQYHNAIALVDKDAAVLVEDSHANKTMVNVAIELIKNEEKLTQLSHNIKAFAYKDADKKIAEVIINQIVKK